MAGYMERIKACAVLIQHAKLGADATFADVERFVWALAILSGRPESEIWAMQQSEWDSFTKDFARQMQTNAVLANVGVGE